MSQIKNPSYIEHTGEITDHLNWFSDNTAQSEINTETFIAAAKVSKLQLPELAKFLKVSPTKLSHRSAAIDKKILKRIFELVLISDLAFKLHKADKQKTISWVMSPNHLFFGRSPFEKALTGEAKSVIDKLEEMIG
jgi:hypothetical protein